MEGIGNRLEDLEDSIVARPTSDKLQEIYQAKWHLVTIRRAVWPGAKASLYYSEPTVRLSSPKRSFLCET